eukprot:782225_1
MGSALYRFRFANIQHLNIITNTSNSIMDHWMDRILFYHEAFRQLMREIHITIDDLLAIPTLTDILLYHIIGDFLLFEDLAYGKDIILRDAQSDDSLITLCDVKAKNGVAHVIDRVMIPLFDDIMQIATSFKDYSILVELIEAAGLTFVLEGPGPFTVFAPNNYAFYNLMEELNINIDDLLRLPILQNVLLYHINGNYLFTTDLWT